ncbi:MAG: hypothetical protein BZY87_03280 [SAR202 cluster bacterium Io17-Chloro-G6]|nr:MAG: hypothetical protein BZY87_03280 [SAR202 cluster bacterium Io17-Chloro-G6]
MGFPLSKSSTIIVFLLLALVAAVIFMSQIRSFFLNLRAETVTIADPSVPGSNGTLDLKIVTVLGRDGIPAILDPVFASRAEALAQMDPSERVLGVSINGDHRAYPLNLLSRHEVVNDTVGGIPIAVTW